MKRLAPSALLLIVLVLAVYAPVRDYGFISYDDPHYVAENPVVARGLAASSLRWAFEKPHFGLWIPLTWLSYLAEVSLYGVQPGKMHLVNLLLHAANAILFFLLLVLMTGARARSLIAAALFAVHPMHVESVAWITERKDVLSTFFGLLALLLWVRYLRRPGVARYLVACLGLALSLMAKPMLVTFPLLLIILDLWPLGRWRVTADIAKVGRGTRTAGWLLAEKAFPAALVAVAAFINMRAVKQFGAVLDRYPWHNHLDTVVTNYWTYVGKFFLPTRLSVVNLVPLRAHPLGVSIVALLGLAISTLIAVRLLRRMPWLPCGWLWYVVAILPVSGIVQAGSQAYADRFTYVPFLGLYVALTWSAGELGSALRWPRAVAVPLAVSTLLVLGFAARQEVGYWWGDSGLFGRAIALDPGNWLALDSLGIEQARLGNLLPAQRFFEQALLHHPTNYMSHLNLSLTLRQLGKRAEALAHLEEAYRLAPDYPAVLMAVALAQLESGQAAEAVTLLRRALVRDKEDVTARFNLARALTAAGREEEALREYAAVLAVKPDWAEAEVNSGVIWAGMGRPGEAIGHFRRAVALDSGHANAHFNLAVALESEGDNDEARREYETVIRLDPGDLEARNAVGELLAMEGNREAAREQFAAVLNRDPANAEAKAGLARLR